MNNNEAIVEFIKVMVEEENPHKSNIDTDTALAWVVEHIGNGTLSFNVIAGQAIYCNKLTGTINEYNINVARAMGLVS